MGTLGTQGIMVTLSFFGPSEHFLALLGTLGTLALLGTLGIMGTFGPSEHFSALWALLNNFWHSVHSGPYGHFWALSTGQSEHFWHF